ncbi:MAG: hypothetical protein JSU70_11695, partial [Phycisphaerales bacterium]
AGTRVDVPDTNPNLVLMSSWQEVHFDLSDFAPVSLTSIKKIYVGVGNRLSPIAGPTGDLFIDDIRLHRPRCVASKLRPDADIAEPFDCKVDNRDFGVFANQWSFEAESRDWAHRVAYWDAAYPSAWAEVEVTVAVRDYLALNGYTVLNANELKTWMDARIADGALSVVVFCKDIVPDTVAETMDDTCTIRRYLDAGGKVVWY